jgi:galactokinase
MSAYARAGGRAVMTQAPAAIDVMGGICEEGGSLLLTATLGLAVRACTWPISEDQLIIQHKSAAAGEKWRTWQAPYGGLSKAADQPMVEDGDPSTRSAVAPAVAVLRQLVQSGRMPAASGGLFVGLYGDMDEITDLGRPCAVATAVLEAATRLFDLSVDRQTKTQWVAQAAASLAGVRRLRLAMTSLAGPATESLMQLRFYPQPSCEVLELPPGVIIAAARTRLSRPTPAERIAQTQICADMGLRLISELNRQDGIALKSTGARLAAITPSEYVRRYRNRLPGKITVRQFEARFGPLRSMDATLDPASVLKVRSRVEHYIYENRRVHDFVTHMARARRVNPDEALAQSGELMYNSHWSHSQRCGIGGVETDRLINAIRRRGCPMGLYGAKVTGGGDGGEVVVLMRDDEIAREALAAAVAEASAASRAAIQLYDGSMAGAEYVETPGMDEMLGSAAAV